MAGIVLHAYIDESGQRGHTDSASPHFLLAAAVVRDVNEPKMRETLSTLRADLTRAEGTYLTWKNIRSHGERMRVASVIGQSAWLKTVTVVSCKRYLDPGEMNVDQMYMYQFRLLLERLSWLARQHNEVVGYTLAHVRKFQIATLGEYEAALRRVETQIDWKHISPQGGQIDQPQIDERLQFADLVVSAQAPAFNPDRFGQIEPRYLQLAAPRIYRYAEKSPVASYGLKMHPWNASTKAAYPWVATL